MTLWSINCGACGFQCYRAGAAEPKRRCPECRASSLTSTRVPQSNPVLVREVNGTVSAWVDGAWVQG